MFQIKKFHSMTAYTTGAPLDCSGAEFSVRNGMKCGSGAIFFSLMGAIFV